MSTISSKDSESAFTRGEKCIFGHLIATFVVILVLAILYFIHLCIVSHSIHGALRVTRRSSTKVVGQHFPLGLVYLSSGPTQALCNSLLLKKKWSLAPGHCAALRTDPDVASLLPSWRIKYIARHGRYLESTIKKSIPHPHFNKDDFSNNIGLFQHDRILDNYEFVFPKTFDLNEMDKYAKRMEMAAWENDASTYKGENGQVVRFSLRPVLLKKCQRFIAPVVDLRSYEFCALLEQTRNYYPVRLAAYFAALQLMLTDQWDDWDDQLQKWIGPMHYLPDHGAVITVDSRIIGFFSWGEKRGRGVPYIIVSLLHFKEWIEDVISI